MRAAVLGHVEWVEMVRVEAVPGQGQIVHGMPWWAGPTGGGPGSAVQLLKLAGHCTLFTALGDDELGHRAERELRAMGLDVQVGWRAEPTRRAFVHIDEIGERTITVVGDRLAPKIEDDLEWDQLDSADAVFITAADLAAIRKARGARTAVATSRIAGDLIASGIELDALVGSADDPAETFSEDAFSPRPKLMVLTEGSRGGRWMRSNGWLRFPPAEPPKVIDRYGSGDSFAGALTYALAAGLQDPPASELAAMCGAAVLGGRGPYEAQLTIRDVALRPAAERGQP